MQILFSSVYGVSIPRTAHEQYKATTRVSRTELKEGDMVFFNTRGGVSHVGFYLQNNKFVHASTGGVTISDLFDPYYLRRFVGVGRVEKTDSLNTDQASTTLIYLIPISFLLYTRRAKYPGLASMLSIR
jgi:hypothetical protein